MTFCSREKPRRRQVMFDQILRRRWNRICLRWLTCGAFLWCLRLSIYRWIPCLQSSFCPLISFFPGIFQPPSVPFCTICDQTFLKTQNLTNVYNNNHYPHSSHLKLSKKCLTFLCLPWRAESLYIHSRYTQLWMNSKVVLFMFMIPTFRLNSKFRIPESSTGKTRPGSGSSVCEFTRPLNQTFGVHTSGLSKAKAVTSRGRALPHLLLFTRGVTITQ